MGATNRLYSRKNAANFITHDHPLIKGCRVNEIYSILILRVQVKPSSNIYFANFFNDDDIN